MNIDSTTFLLNATEAFAAVVVLGALLEILFQKPGWGRATAHLGMIGGGLSTALLAIALFRSSSDDSVPAGTWVWTVFSFQEPRPLSLVFGLKATALTAVLSSLSAGLFLWLEWFESSRKNPNSDIVRYIRRLLYPITISFLLALHLTQAIFSWGLASLLAILLIYLAQATGKPRTAPFAERGNSVPPELLAARLHRVSELFVRAWRMLTFQIPNWLGEQAEYLSDCSDFIRLLATVSGMIAILLTWLLVI